MFFCCWVNLLVSYSVILLEVLGFFLFGLKRVRSVFKMILIVFMFLLFLERFLIKDLSVLEVIDVGKFLVKFLRLRIVVCLFFRSVVELRWLFKVVMVLFMDCLVGVVEIENMVLN